MKRQLAVFVFGVIHPVQRIKIADNAEPRELVYQRFYRDGGLWTDDGKTFYPFAAIRMLKVEESGQPKEKIENEQQLDRIFHK